MRIADWNSVTRELAVTASPPTLAIEVFSSAWRIFSARPAAGA